MVSFCEDIVSKFEKEHPYAVETQLLSSPTILQVDSALFRRVVVNLLSNSFKYSGEQKDILVAMNTQNGSAVVEVSDRGMGASSDEYVPLHFRDYLRLPAIIDVVV